MSHLMKREYRVLVILPNWAYYGGKDGNRAVKDVNILNPFVRDGTVNFAPSHTDDDEFCLSFARDRPYIRVLSNDNYQQYVTDGFVTADWRRQYVIKYMFIGECFVPQDR